ncbi:MAG: hypothetical protein ACLKAK_07375 [Alkaliphilus sp.]
MDLKQLKKRYERLEQRLQELERNFASDYNIRRVEETKEELSVVYEEICTLEGGERQ